MRSTSWERPESGDSPIKASGFLVVMAVLLVGGAVGVISTISQGRAPTPVMVQTGSTTP